MKVSDIKRIPDIEQLFPMPYNYEEIKADMGDMQKPPLYDLPYI